MTDYEISETFRRSCNFLRVRSSPDVSINNVIYTIPKEEYAGTILEVRIEYGLKFPGWFKVDKVRRPNGTKAAAGWVKREYEGLTTLVPKSEEYWAAGNDAGSDHSHVTRAGSDTYQEVMSRRQVGNLNQTYVNREIENADNSIAVFSDGVICWKYLDDINIYQRRVRVVKRKVVVSDRGRGLDIVRWMESEAVAADPFCSGERPDVVLFILESVPDAHDAHLKHGYEDLCTHRGKSMMYRQVPGNRVVNFKRLGRQEVEAIARRYDLAPDCVSESFFVAWHVNDHAEGRKFKSRAEAERHFNRLEGGLWAAIIVDQDMTNLEPRYGWMHEADWQQLYTWCRQAK